MAKSLFRICGRGFFAWRAPRMWGILTECCAEAARLRFIPTRVGNTAHTAPPRLCRAVHPHACGEYDHRLRTARAGSRFIPTRVGNTHAPVRPAHAGGVHPHACGEYFGIFFLQFFQCGSSPRVWGIRRGARRDARPARFIPTRVGNTPLLSTEYPDPTVHPHACGEYPSISVRRSCCGGSSPRVWGIRIKTCA